MDGKLAVRMPSAIQASEHPQVPVASTSSRSHHIQRWRGKSSRCLLGAPRKSHSGAIGRARSDSPDREEHRCQDHGLCMLKRHRGRGGKRVKGSVPSKLPRECAAGGRLPLERLLIENAGPSESASRSSAPEVRRGLLMVHSLRPKTCRGCRSAVQSRISAEPRLFGVLDCLKRGTRERETSYPTEHRGYACSLPDRSWMN